MTEPRTTDVRRTFKRERERIGEPVKVFVGSITNVPGSIPHSYKEATGAFAKFEPELEWDTRALKWISWMLAAAVVVAWWMA